jgi:hypothetical protein
MPYDREQAAAIAEHDRIMAEAAAERPPRPLLRSGGATPGLVYKVRENSLVAAAASAPAVAPASAADGDIIEAVSIALADTASRLQRVHERKIAKLERRIAALGAALEADGADRRSALDLALAETTNRICCDYQKQIDTLQRRVAALEADSKILDLPALPSWRGVSVA